MAFSNFISNNPNNIEPFSLFSTSHIFAILTIIIFITLTTLVFRYTKMNDYSKQFRYFLLAVIVIEEILFKLWIIYESDKLLIDNLQLNLCGVSLMLSIFLLYNKNQTLYEIVFYWGIAGATQAILTPDIGQYGYPHFRFFQFFLSHGLILMVSVYMTAVEGLRLGKGSLKRIIIITNTYTLFVGIVNYLIGTNYLLLARKPDSASLLDFLGPWPWYILSLEVIAIILFSLIYIPFYLARNKKEDKNISFRS